MDLSIVVPVYNEEENIQYLYDQLTEVLEPLHLEYEIICADDGSKDRSFELLKELARKDPRIKVLRFRRNFGQTAGFSAGFAYASGDIVITIDADLQNDPAGIPILLAKMAEGYDVVSGWRTARQDAYLSRKLPSRIANWLISRTTGVQVHDRGCSLRAHRREIVAIVLRRHRDALRAHGLRGDWVHGEGVLGVDRGRARCEEGARGQVEDVVGTVSQHDRVRRDAEFFRQLRLQRETGAVGIQGHVVQCVLRRRQGHRTGAERVLVRCELDDVGFVQSQFARKFGNGFARLVRGDRTHVRRREFTTIHHDATG